MERLQIKDSDIMRIAIQQEIDRSEESRYDHRLHGVLMVAAGYSCTDVAQVFGHEAMLKIEAYSPAYHKSGSMAKA